MSPRDIKMDDFSNVFFDIILHVMNGIAICKL